VSIPTDSQDDESMLTASQVRARYGGTSAMWLGRKLNHDPSFPRPYYAGSRRLWRLGELRVWDRALPRTPPAALVTAATKGVAAKKAAKAAAPPNPPEAAPSAQPRMRRRREHGPANRDTKS
jgi:hypothetical protein